MVDELSQGVVHFVPPVPPVRRAVAQEDGSLILDFPSEESRQDFKLKCIARVEANCMKGARASCASRALAAAADPWWRRLLRLPPASTPEAREAAAAAALDACLLQAGPACNQHASGFCSDVVRCK